MYNACHIGSSDDPEHADWIKLKSSINKGVSGSPVVDCYGTLIGMVSYIRTQIESESTILKNCLFETQAYKKLKYYKGIRNIIIKELINDLNVDKKSIFESLISYIVLRNKMVEKYNIIKLDDIDTNIDHV